MNTETTKLRLRTDGEHFYSVARPKCENCGVIQNRQFIQILLYGKSQKKEKHSYCMNCCFQIAKFHEIEVHRLVIVKADFPENTRPVAEVPPELKPVGNYTVWDAVRNDVAPCPHVDDYTRLAGRESWEGSQIGAKVEEPQKIPAREVGSFLRQLRGAEIITRQKQLEKKERKLLDKVEK